MRRQTHKRRKRRPAPAHGLDAREKRIEKSKNPLGRIFSILGPGLITGASDDDPSGIGTYASAGAAFGYATLWTAVFSFPMMAAVQFMCAKIGMVTGGGLARVLRHHYPPAVLYVAVFLLFLANTINAGADIGAIVDALHLLVPIPVRPTYVVVAAAIVLLQLFGTYDLIARIFKWLTLSLFAYVGSSFLASPDAQQVLRGSLIPTIRMDRAFIAMIVGLFGTTISPYLFFWQASQEVEEEITVGRTKIQARQGATEKQLGLAALDVNAGMLLSNLVMYFIILASAATLHHAGKTHVESAVQAAEALRPIAGGAASILLAVGMIGAGLLAVPILTGSAAYAVAEAFGWKHSLSAKPRLAKPFYAVIALSTALGLLINFLGIEPFDALVGAAILNGILAPPLMVLILHISNNSKIMGKRTNTRWTNVLGWITVAVVGAAAIALIFTR